MIVDILIITGAFIFLIGTAVLVHELGHLLAAKMLGIKVKKFSLFFGRRLFGFRIGETDYRVSLIPLGGYVELYGENGGRKKKHSRKQSRPLAVLRHIFLGPPEVSRDNCAHPDAFCARPRWQKIVVYLAGPVFSILLFIGMTAGIFMMYGDHYAAPETAPPIIARTLPGSIAEDAGILPHDRIVSVDGVPVHSWIEAQMEISTRAQELITINIERSGTMESINLVVGEATKYKMGDIGIAPQFPQSQKLTAPVAIKKSVAHGFNLVALNITALEKLFSGELQADETLSGPIEIAAVSGMAAQQGFDNLLYITAVVSLILGLFNMLPIPLLDGGQILILSLESLIRRPLPKIVVFYMNRFGVTAVFMLMMFAMYFDLKRNIPLIIEMF